MRLRIEDGLLLKEHHRPWRPEGWDDAPDGWRADDTNEWAQARADELTEKAVEAMGREGVELSEVQLRGARVVALAQAVEEQGEALQEQEKPWLGWVPVLPTVNRKIIKVYRASIKGVGHWLPDGLYRIESKRLVREGDDG